MSILNAIATSIVVAKNKKTMPVMKVKDVAGRTQKVLVADNSLGNQILRNNNLGMGAAARVKGYGTMLCLGEELRGMSKNAREFTIAHEIGHIANRDLQAMAKQGKRNLRSGMSQAENTRQLRNIDREKAADAYAVQQIGRKASIDGLKAARRYIRTGRFKLAKYAVHKNPEVRKIAREGLSGVSGSVKEINERIKHVKSL